MLIRVTMDTTVKVAASTFKSYNKRLNSVLSQIELFLSHQSNQASSCKCRTSSSVSLLAATSFRRHLHQPGSTPFPSLALARTRAWSAWWARAWAHLASSSSPLHRSLAPSDCRTCRVLVKIKLCSQSDKLTCNGRIGILGFFLHFLLEADLKSSRWWVQWESELWGLTEQNPLWSGNP